VIVHGRGLLSAAADRRYGGLRDVAEPLRSLSDICADLGLPPRLARFFWQANLNLPQLLQDRVLVRELLFPDGGILAAGSAYHADPADPGIDTATGRPPLGHSRPPPVPRPQTLPPITVTRTEVQPCGCRAG
jgi:hypothetical protein